MTTTDSGSDIQSILPSKFKACAAIFDFGGTLAIKEAEESDVRVTLDPLHARDKVFGGRKRVAMIRKSLKALTEIGVSCVILSYNKGSIIKRLLKAAEVEIDKYFEFVVGQEDIPHDESSTWKKSDGVATIMMRMGITFASRVFFLDNSSDDTREVMTLMPSCCTHWVKHPDGLRESHFQAVRLWGELLNNKSISFTEEEKEAEKAIRILQFRRQRTRTRRKLRRY